MLIAYILYYMLYILSLRIIAYAGFELWKMNWEGQQRSKKWEVGGHNGMDRGTGGLNPNPRQFEPWAYVLMHWAYCSIIIIIINHISNALKSQSLVESKARIYTWLDKNRLKIVSFQMTFERLNCQWLSNVEWNIVPDGWGRNGKSTLSQDGSRARNNKSL